MCCGERERWAFIRFGRLNMVVEAHFKMRRDFAALSCRVYEERRLWFDRIRVLSTLTEVVSLL